MDSDRARALAALAAGLDERLASLDADLVRLRAARGAESADDEHDPDGSPLSGEWSRIAGLREDLLRERADLAEIRVRAEAGRDGVCRDCGAPIPAARLEARPTATRCVLCAQRAGR